MKTTATKPARSSSAIGTNAYGAPVARIVEWNGFIYIPLRVALDILRIRIEYTPDAYVIWSKFNTLEPIAEHSRKEFSNPWDMLRERGLFDSARFKREAATWLANNNKR